jgi:hypothetical protein
MYARALGATFASIGGGRLIQWRGPLIPPRRQVERSRRPATRRLGLGRCGSARVSFIGPKSGGRPSKTTHFVVPNFVKQEITSPGRRHHHRPPPRRHAATPPRHHAAARRPPPCRLACSRAQMLPNSRPWLAQRVNRSGPGTRNGKKSKGAKLMPRRMLENLAPHSPRSRAPTPDVGFEAARVGAGSLPAPMGRTLRHRRTISVHDIRTRAAFRKLRRREQRSGTWNGSCNTQKYPE